VTPEAAAPGLAIPGARARIAALLRVLLAEGLRRGRSAEGTEVRPLRQVLFASSLLGVFCALPLRHETPAYWLQALSLYAALYTALAVVPDPQDAFERRRDILGPLPIRPLEAALARLVFLALVVSLLIVPLTLPSLVWLLVRGALAPWQVVGAGAGIVAVSFTVTGAWLFVAFAIGRRLGIDRLRRVASLLMSLLIAVSSLVGSAELWIDRPWDPGAGAALLAAAPTSWYLAPALAPAAAGAPAAAALALLLLAALLAARTDPTRAYAAGAAARPQRDGWVSRGVARLDASRPADADRRRLPLVLFLSRAWGRDAFTAMRVRAFGASALVLLVVSWFWQTESVALPVTVACLGFMALADGALDLAMSSDSDAVWLLDVAPVASELLLAAARATVLAARGLLPALVLAVATALEHGPTTGLGIGVAFLGVGYLLVSAVQLVRPRRPFAQQASAARGTVAIWVASPLAFAALLALAPAVAAAMLPAGLDLVASGLMAGALYAFGRACGLLAAGRHARAVAAGR
jgi:hypothetical protein